MLKRSELKKVPKDNHTFYENLHTQPLNERRVFNRPFVLTESWYPVCLSKKIPKTSSRSFTLLHQRFVIWRDENGQLHASDAFCPHMGADLGNGNVVNGNLQCYFHHWTFNGEGKCLNHGHKKLLNVYPIKEKYGFIWIYPGETPSHDIPHPPGLENTEVKAIHLMTLKLFAHHHVMMVGGIDLQHFKSVHQLDIKFDYEIADHNDDVYTWSLRGGMPSQTLLQKLAHYLTGGEFRYQALFAGGTIATLTYGNDLLFKGKGRKLPSVHMFWGCRPTLDGVSEIEIFFITKKYHGLLAPFKRTAQYLLGFLLQASLRDDDSRAFPNMRFHLGHMTEKDQSVLDLADRFDKLKISKWTKDDKKTDC